MSWWGNREIGPRCGVGWVNKCWALVRTKVAIAERDTPGGMLIRIHVTVLLTFAQHETVHHRGDAGKIMANINDKGGAFPTGKSTST